MDAHQFWTIIDETRAEAGGTLDAQVETLHARLSELAVDQVVAFDEQLIEANHALYSWTLWGATDLIFGSGGDDAFTDARSWVVSLGSATYHRVLADVQALAEVSSDVEPEDLTVAERWAGVPAEVYAGHTGRHLEEVFPERTPISQPEGEPEGTQLSDDPDVLAEHFPRLAARFG